MNVAGGVMRVPRPALLAASAVGYLPRTRSLALGGSGAAITAEFLPFRGHPYALWQAGDRLAPVPSGS